MVVGSLQHHAMYTVKARSFYLNDCISNSTNESVCMKIPKILQTVHRLHSRFHIVNNFRKVQKTTNS